VQLELRAAVLCWLVLECQLSAYLVLWQYIHSRAARNICTGLWAIEAGALLFDQTAGTGQNADLWGFCPAPKCERPISVGAMHRGLC
jgi:hypothetical protein